MLEGTGKKMSDAKRPNIAAMVIGKDAGSFDQAINQAVKLEPNAKNGKIGISSTMPIKKADRNKDRNFPPFELME
jgi:hypothetical protein